jgi:hypothetical protein
MTAPSPGLAREDARGEWESAALLAPNAALADRAMVRALEGLFSPLPGARMSPDTWAPWDIPCAVVSTGEGDE